MTSVKKILRIIALLTVLLAGHCHCHSASKDGPDCPQPNCPAESCDSTNCQLPNCYCSSTDPPAGIDVQDMPQIVTIAFESAFTELLYSTYYLNLSTFRNPDNCEIGITYFLDHEYTDYQIVHDAWTKGHEIASFSISSAEICQETADPTHQEWVDEIVGMKEIASTFANISFKDIVGCRAACSSGCGDTLFQVLQEYDFVYDNSMPTTKYMNPPIFPYTLDYRSLLWCPVDTYPGFWEFPIVAFNDTEGLACLMLDVCPATNTTNGTFDLIMKNFLFHYNTNRAPFQINLKASWFLTDPAHWSGFLTFIEYINGLSDVYIMTVSKALAWLREPTKLSDLPNFTPWACTKPTSECFPQNTCDYADDHPSMNVCGECPPHYPWIGDPYGNATVSNN